MSQPKLLDQVRNLLRVKHYSFRTEETYIGWIRRFILFHGKRHPKDMGEAEISAFLTHLAVDRNVSAATQNQAFNALLFLYRNVLEMEFGDLGNVVRAKKPKKLPVVFTKDEVKRIVGQLDGFKWLMAHLMYGAGLRVMECVRLRIKDIDFGYRQIIVRDGKGQKDRITMLPMIIEEPLKRHLDKVKILHEGDLRAGFGSVYMPFALDRKYKNADRSWAWQYTHKGGRAVQSPGDLLWS